jgi:integrase
MRQAEPWKRRQGGAWYAWVKRKQVWLAPAGATKEAAWEALRAHQAGRRPSAAPIPTSTVAGLLAGFLGVQEAREREGQITRHTLDHYTALLGRAILDLGGLPVASLTPPVVLGWAKGRGWSSGRQRGAVQAMRAAIRWGLAGGLVASDPLAGIKLPPAPARTFDATKEVRERIKGAITDPAFLAFLVGCELSGCRPGEVAAVTAADFDPEAGTWKVRNKTRWATGEAHRLVFLPPALVEMCTGLAEANPTGPLFRNSRGRPWLRATWGRLMRETRRKLELSEGLVMHSLRAAFFTDGLSAGVSPAVMAELVGHSSLSMFKHYSRLAQRRTTLRDAVNAIRGGPGSEPGTPASGAKGEAKGPKPSPSRAAPGKPRGKRRGPPR